MNYIVLNGMKSTLIKGLLISELPPITKPLIRTKTEEIDGRDGDIVTKLGYAAYDKKMSIGLYGDFNIDDIIQYFDSEGTVVFSNEPDKVYRYQINNQIDFERLLRFKTATVVFHVQPFKFSSVDDKITLSKNKLIIPNQSKKIEDLTITCTDNNVTIDGETGMGIVWRDVTVDKILLKANTEYTLSFTLSTSGSSKISVGIINAATGDILGGSYVTMSESHTITYTPSQDEVYDTLHIEVLFSYDADITFNAKLETNSAVQTFEVINRGNVISKPTITLIGTGAATLTVNNKTVSISNIDHEGVAEITLNVETMNAYSNYVDLRNRDITGDLRQLAFEIGRNTLSYTGNVNLIYVERGSRWI